MGALMRYTSNPDHLSDVPRDMLEVVLLVARKDWKQNPAKGVIQNMRRDPLLAAAFKQYKDIDSDSD